MNLTTYLQTMPRLGMNESITPLSLYLKDVSTEKFTSTLTRKLNITAVSLFLNIPYPYSVYRRNSFRVCLVTRIEMHLAFCIE